MNTTWWVKPNELDQFQRRVIDLPLEHSHLITGPPGSGKTNLLLLRASQMVRSGKPNVIVLTFTRTLREFLAQGAAQYGLDPLKVYTLNAWGMQFLRNFGVTFDRTGDFETNRRQQLESIQGALTQQSIGNTFDAIVLDEAQDYSAGELDVFFKLGAVVFAASDHRQQIYTTSPGAPDALSSRFGGNVYGLKYHYRNGPKICQLADELAKPWRDYQRLLPTSQYDDQANLSTVTPIVGGPIAAQTDLLIQNLRNQLKAYPGQHLGVLCPTNATLREVWAILQQSDLAPTSVCQSAEEGFAAFDSSTPICVCSAHSAKGIEFRAVHLLDVQNLNKSSRARNVAYMAVTRAKTSLTLYAATHFPGYIESALASLSPMPPVARLNDLFL